jgi:hypothetical protein
MKVLVPEPCLPPIGTIAFGDHELPALAERMRALFTEDQAARRTGIIDWERLATEDTHRRIEILTYLTHGQLCSPESLYAAAFIFQHGTCPDHYHLAHQLAARALQLGYSPARWLFAATLDRYLMSLGQPQKYGTQYISYGDGPMELWLYDQATTDQERQQYDVPPLAEVLRQLQKDTG